MNSLFTNILSLRCIEYLIVNEHWKIIELSPKIHLLADNSDEVRVEKRCSDGLSRINWN